MNKRESRTVYVYSEITTDKPISMDSVEGNYVWMARFKVDNDSLTKIPSNVDDLIRWCTIRETRVLVASRVNFCGQEIPFNEELSFFSNHNSTNFIELVKTVMIDQDSSYVYFGIPSDGRVKGSANIQLTSGKIENAYSFEVGQTMDEVKNSHHNDSEEFSRFKNRLSWLLQ